MNTRHHFLLVLAATFYLLSCQISIATEDDFLWIWHHIYITNDLPGDPLKKLMVHCKDKTKDLGVHYLSQKEVFHFKASIDFFRRRLYFCNMQWNGKQTYIEAFKAKRDEDRCRKHCMWSVREDGFYFSNGNGNWNKEYQW
ncbi:unnamed protein product [Dovyalis caffra]|uniref:S-protein homolog n=1 Tax=Dovyalis caffra TaxID=77055 RepID=A0AAV1R8C8_9ROSI|nr:unnamed protein product [Dovyalis caffra]